MRFARARSAIRFLARRLSATERRLKAARWAASTGDWPAAAAAYGHAASARPARGDILVQWGHALKEAGDRERAVAAYRRAGSLAPTDTDVRIHLAALLRHRPSDRAEAANLYRAVMLLDPGNMEALRGLIELGARSMIPEQALASGLVQAGQRDVIAAKEALLRAERAAAALSTMPLPLYALFRRRQALAPPPVMGTDRQFVVVLGENGSAAMLDATLRSLDCQSARPDEIVVVVGEALADHPVYGLARAKPTPRRVSSDELIAGLANETMVIVVPAGAVLEEHATAWLSYARDRGRAVTVYGDHDELTEDSRVGRHRGNPVLFASHDSVMIAEASEPPLVILTSGEVAGEALQRGLTGWDAVAEIAATAVPAVHVPRVLASRYRLPSSARPAPPGRGVDQETRIVCRSLPRLSAWNGVEARRKVAVVIPTRDHAALLRRAVESLTAMATAPGRIEFVVVDNRSRENETRLVLNALTEHGARIVTLDQPFNWSRANNLGVVATDADLLVFANNDVEAISLGWDDIVEQRLSRPDIGVVGARLLYPDRSYQHAGVLFGVGDGTLSIHEGVGFPCSEAGPNGRWIASRRASAVTGAFLACTRSTFLAAQGFNEGLAIAYNDLDFCFRVRALGKAVLYEPRLCLIHHESKTRGQNISQDQLAWDERERLVFAAEWAADIARQDPGYNPQWARDGWPFDGMREPSMEEILAWIDTGASGPWRTQAGATSITSGSGRT